MKYALIFFVWLTGAAAVFQVVGGHRTAALILIVLSMFLYGLGWLHMEDDE
jgi:hypothetical protein